jgi:hypothetical protein
LRSRRDHPLRVAAPHEEPGNAITSFHVSDAVANDDHGAGAFDSWRRRQCVHRLGVTPPRPCIHEVHAGKGDINKNLSSARRSQLDVIKFHYFGAAISAYDNCLHRLYPFI